jgi:hypothetical protein
MTSLPSCSIQACGLFESALGPLCPPVLHLDSRRSGLATNVTFRPPASSTTAPRRRGPATTSNDVQRGHEDASPCLPSEDAYATIDLSAKRRTPNERDTLPGLAAPAPVRQTAKQLIQNNFQAGPRGDLVQGCRQRRQAWAVPEAACLAGAHLSY